MGRKPGKRTTRRSGTSTTSGRSQLKSNGTLRSATESSAGDSRVSRCADRLISIGARPSEPMRYVSQSARPIWSARATPDQWVKAGKSRPETLMSSIGDFPAPDVPALAFQAEGVTPCGPINEVNQAAGVGLSTKAGADQLADAAKSRLVKAPQSVGILLVGAVTASHATGSR